MGRDASHIIRNDFHGDLSGPPQQSAIEYCKATIEKLRKALNIEGDIEFRIYYNCGDPYTEYQFYIGEDKYSSIEFGLHNGFWNIESYFSWWQIAAPNEKGQLWLRDMIVDFARILGEKEIWHACETLTWNGMDEKFYKNMTLEEWIEAAKLKSEGDYAEFDYEAIVKENSQPYPHELKCNLFYHDSIE